MAGKSNKRSAEGASNKVSKKVKAERPPSVLTDFFVPAPKGADLTSSSKGEEVIDENGDIDFTTVDVDLIVQDIEKGNLDPACLVGSKADQPLDEVEYNPVEEEIDQISDEASAKEEVLKAVGLETSFANYAKALLSCIEDDAVRAEIEAFSEEVIRGNAARARPQEPLYAFLDKAGPEWSDHCPEITKEWDRVTQFIDIVTGGKVDWKQLTKVSGVLDAPVTNIWEYATFTTKKAVFGHVMDPTNPCLRSQDKKIGPNDLVRTQDRNPCRKSFTEKADWATYFGITDDAWKKVEARLLAFNKWLNRKSHFVILHGKENFVNAKMLFEVKDLEHENVHVVLPKANRLYTKPHYISLLRNRATKKIEKVLFFVYHAQFFFHATEETLAARHDLVLNAAYELGGIKVLREDYTLRQIRAINKNPRQPADLLNLLTTATRMRHQEMSTGKPLDPAQVRSIFGDLDKKHPELAAKYPLNPADGLLKQFLSIWASKGGYSITAAGMEIRRTKLRAWWASKTDAEKEEHGALTKAGMQKMRAALTAEQAAQLSSNISAGQINRRLVMTDEERAQDTAKRSSSTKAGVERRTTEQKAKHSANLKAAWADPVKKAARLEAIRKGREKKKLEREQQKNQDNHKLN